MKHRVTTYLGIPILIALMLVLSGCQGIPSMLSEGIEKQPPDEMYTRLRNMALETDPAKMGIAVDPNGQEPYGVIMDMGLSNGVATLVSFSTGDTSLYYSTGGGMLGGGGHQTVANASKRLVSLAGNYTSKMQKTITFPLPARDKVRFYVRTPQGVLTAEVDQQDLSKSSNDFSALYAAAQDVITQFRLVSQKQSKP